MNPFLGDQQASINSLLHNDIHLWRIPFHPQKHRIAFLYTLLSESEKDRTNRFVHKILSDKYIYFHGILRIILCKYLSITPTALRFEKNAFGKPQVAQEHNLNSIHFSFSDSGDLGLVAIVRNYPLGVDVEKIRKVPEAKNIIISEFTAEERCDLLPLTETEIIEPFFICWTQKEAYIKAIGKGLSYPLNRFSSPIRDFNNTMRKRGSIIGHARVNGWRVDLLRPQRGYVGAIIARQSAQKLRMFDFVYGQDTMS